jgi:hypothetical protein
VCPVPPQAISTLVAADAHRDYVLSLDISTAYNYVKTQPRPAQNHGRRNANSQSQIKEGPKRNAYGPLVLSEMYYVRVVSQNCNMGGGRI